MSARKVFVIGASAGGVEALTKLIPALPAGFAAPIAVVTHIPAASPSFLADILTRRGNLPARQAEDGEPLLDGVIFVPPPDRHLIIDSDHTVRTPRGPLENRHRPAVDPLFRSAAFAFGAGTTGVILSGTLDDGTAGLLAIKQSGGIAIAQEPADALYPGMPQSAIEHVDVDYVLPVSQIGAQLVRILSEERPNSPEERELIAMETNIAKFTAEALQDEDRPGKPSPFSCPDCGGVLWEIEDETLARYRCCTGHAFSPETMLGAQGEVLEEAMMAALKTLEETARLSRRLAQNEQARGHDWMAARFYERERDARRRAEVIRQFVAGSNATVPEETAAAKKKLRS